VSDRHSILCWRARLLDGETERLWVLEKRLDGGGEGVEIAEIVPYDPLQLLWLQIGIEMRQILFSTASLKLSR